MKKFTLFVVSIILLLLVSSCSVFDTVKDITRLEYKLNGVDQFKVSGILVENKKKLDDFTATDLLSFANSVRQGKLPVSFDIKIAAKNPGEVTEQNKSSSVRITSFPWQLIINGKETIKGNISNPVSVPARGATEIFSIQAELDLVDFFRNEGYKELLNLALNIGGQNADPSLLEIKTKPVLDTPYGAFHYPDTITVVSHEFH